MTPLEDDIRESLTRRTATPPPLPTVDALLHRAHRSVRRGRLTTALTAAVTVVTIALGSSAIATRSHHSEPAQPGPTPAPTTFVAAQSPGLNEKTGTTTTQLQERSLADGHLVRVIASVTSVYQDFALAPDGSILAAVSNKSGCNATIERIDRQTGERHVIRRVAQSVVGMSVSPDGNRVAFVTDVDCFTTKLSMPSVVHPAFVQSSAPNHAAPSGFAILDLKTGSLVTTHTEGPGLPLGRASWSPDGTQVASDYVDGTVLLMPSEHPDFRTARRVVAPRGCAYRAPAWTRAGLAVAKACGHKGAVPDVKAVVRLDTTKTVETRSWPVPTCTNGFGLVPAVRGDGLITEMSIGHGYPGEDPCADDKVKWHSLLAEVQDGGLRTILDEPGETESDITIVGW